MKPKREISATNKKKAQSKIKTRTKARHGEAKIESRGSPTREEATEKKQCM